MFQFLIPVLAGGFDRARGDGYFSTFCAAFFGCLLAAALLRDPSWLILATGAAFALGERPGWGAPMGAALSRRRIGGDYEWWEFGPLEDRPLLSLAFRGLMWGVPVLPLTYFEPALGAIPIVMAIAFPAGVAWAREFFPAKTRWGAAEAARGVIAGGLCVFLGLPLSPAGG